MKLLNFVNKLINYIKINGMKSLFYRVFDKTFTLGVSYKRWYKENKPSQEMLEKQKEVTFTYSPLISIIVPTYNTPIEYLQEMIDSVINQTYSNWELCIAEGSTDNNKVLECIKSYTNKDNRIKYTKIGSNLGISGNTNVALSMAIGEYIALFDHDDLLSSNCLFEIVKTLNTFKYDIIYTDEDKVDEKSINHFEPAFKPDWSPDLFYSHNYITHFFVVKSEIVEEVGGFKSEYDGAQDYDFILRCIEKSKSIYHIPIILYHWRMHQDSTSKNPESKLYCYDAGKNALQDYFHRNNINANVEHMSKWGMYHVKYNIINKPLVSIIIPNKDHIEDLDRCIKSLSKSIYDNYEIIIVENNSEIQETFDYYNNLEKNNKNIKVVTWNGEFNYSLINNLGVSYAKGDLLLFLNNDTELISPESISEMVGICSRSDVGVVGAKLLYSDNTVQHAGVVLGLGDYGGFAGHVFTGIPSNDCGYMNRPILTCNYSAVTAACMMVKRKLFEEVGGFTEEFVVSLNDIDLCLKIRELDKVVVYNPFSLWYHFESKSRGYENTPEKIERFKKEIEKFQSKWNNYIINGDPYYNKNFDLKKGAFRLNLLK